MELKVLGAKEIGDRVRMLRRRVGLSQEELGAVAFSDEQRGTAGVVIGRIERGDGSNTSLQKLVALASAFAVLREEFSAQEVLDYFEGRADSVRATLEVRPTLHAIEGEGKPNWGVPSSKSRSRRAPKKQDKAAGQVDIQCSPLRPLEQPIPFEVAA